MTDSIGKLALALSKAQAEIKGAKKDAENPFFKSTYADLASVWEACRTALSNNELSVAQTTDLLDGSIVLKTILMHSSGEMLIGVLPVLVGEKATSQQLGSAITYNRRYALAAMAGVAPEEDDGNKASETSGKTTFKKPDDGLQQKAQEFVRRIELCENVEELNLITAKNSSLLLALHENLPTWDKRVSERIDEQKAALTQ